MNQKMKTHIEEALAQGVRLDGRKLDEMRPITIETGTVGGCRIPWVYPRRGGR